MSFSFIKTYINLIRSGMSPSEAYTETNKINPNNSLTRSKPVQPRKRGRVSTKA